MKAVAFLLPAPAMLTPFPGLTCRLPAAWNMLPVAAGPPSSPLGGLCPISLLRVVVHPLHCLLPRAQPFRCLSNSYFVGLPVTLHLLAVGTLVTSVSQVSGVEPGTPGRQSAFPCGFYRRSLGSLCWGLGRGPGVLGGSAAPLEPGETGHLMAFQEGPTPGASPMAETRFQCVLLGTCRSPWSAGLP